MSLTQLAVAPFAAFALLAAGPSDPAFAQVAAKPKPARTAPAKKPAAPAVPEATPEQREAAALVYIGRYECEFNQVIDVQASPRHAAYVDVKFGKQAWLMKPVLSSTGAVRLEDVKGETLVVQIANKSMLMNVKAGRRLVDECISDWQRELIAAAAEAKAREAALAAAQAASAAAVAASSAAVAASAAAEAASAASAVAK